MEEQFIYGIIKTDQLNEALDLVRRIFLEYEAPEYSDEGIQEFMRFIDLESIRQMISASKIILWVCETCGKIVGVLGARSGHINLLFVDGKYHRRGIARQLFNVMLLYYKPSVVTVNSSPYAVPAYRKLCFVDTDVEQTLNGIRFIPMRYEHAIFEF